MNFNSTTLHTLAGYLPQTGCGRLASRPLPKVAPALSSGNTGRVLARVWVTIVASLVWFAPTLGSAQENTAKPAAPAPAAASIKAGEVPTVSRYVTPEHLPAFVAAMLDNLSINGRATDPFGQYQDPDAKPVARPTVAKRSRQVAPIKATPFAEIVRLIKVNTVMPADKQFLIGTRTVKEGETLPLNFRGRSIKVTVTQVSSRQIEFRNQESGETASITLNLMPAGMTMGSGGLTPPGMVPEIPDAPIDLDPGDAFNSHP